MILINIPAFAFCGLFLFGSSIMAFSQSGLIIVNKANPLTTLSPGQAKLLYLRKVKRIWSETNKPIKPVDVKGNKALRMAFLSEIISMSSAEIEQYFKQRQFANSETLPTEFFTEEQVVDFVSENEGAIGYISEVAYGTFKDKVRAVCKF